MFSEKILTIYNYIIEEAQSMVSRHVDFNDLTNKIDYASIFAQSDSEFNEFSKELEKNGKVADVQPSGNYFLLKQPFTTKFGTITKCRVRKPDQEHKERGYVDFETTDFAAFKRKYLIRPYFSQKQNVHGIDLVGLHDPKYNVRVYFPESL